MQPTDCWLRTGRTAASGTRFASPLGFWGSFLSTQTYPKSPEGSLTRGVQLARLVGRRLTLYTRTVGRPFWRLIFCTVFGTFGLADPIYPGSLPKVFAFILTVIYRTRDILQAPRDFDLGVLIYAV